METTAKMEAYKAQLDKVIEDFKESMCNAGTKNEGKSLTNVNNQLFDNLISVINKVMNFYHELSVENDKLTKTNIGLKSTCDRLVRGIGQIHVNEKEEVNGELRAVNIQLKQENDELKARINCLRKKVSDLIQTCEMTDAEKTALEHRVAELETHVSFYKEAAAVEQLPYGSLYQAEANQLIQAINTQMDEKDKVIASLEEENRQLKARNVQSEKNIIVYQKMIEDQSKHIEKLENPNKTSAAVVVNTPLPGNPDQHIDLKEAVNGTDLNYALAERKILVIKRLLSTNFHMTWDAYTTFDDVNEKPVKINLRYANLKFHLNGLLSVHKIITPNFFSMLDTCSLIDVRLYYITISYSQFMKLVSSGTVKTLYLICVVIKDERQKDMSMDSILREVSNVENLTFVFPSQAQVTANNFSQLPYFPKLKKVTFGNIPENIDEPVVVAFEKKYPNASCNHSYRRNFNNDRDM